VTKSIVLSPRQTECLARIAAGQTSQEIGSALGLSARTIDHYVGFACAKLGVRNRAQAVAEALRLDLIPAPSKTCADVAIKPGRRNAR
jgi:DNA-binding CsgD family transcriptional regulator